MCRIGEAQQRVLAPHVVDALIPGEQLGNVQPAVSGDALVGAREAALGDEPSHDDFHASLAEGKPTRSGVRVRHAEDLQQVTTALQDTLGAGCQLVNKSLASGLQIVRKKGVTDSVRLGTQNSHRAVQALLNRVSETRKTLSWSYDQCHNDNVKNAVNHLQNAHTELLVLQKNSNRRFTKNYLENSQNRDAAQQMYFAKIDKRHFDELEKLGLNFTELQMSREAVKQALKHAANTFSYDEEKLNKQPKHVVRIRKKKSKSQETVTP